MKKLDKNTKGKLSKIISSSRNKKMEKNLGGRPTIYTQELAQIILDRLIHGECLEEICRDKAMPSLTAIFQWRKKYPWFKKGYLCARKRQAENFGDQIKLMVDKVVKHAEQCEETMGATSKVKSLVEAVKLRAGMYQWLAGKYNVKLFGDQSRQTVKTDLTIKQKEEVPISERINRIKEKARNYVGDDLNKAGTENK